MDMRGVHSRVLLPSREPALSLLTSMGRLRRLDPTLRHPLRHRRLLLPPDVHPPPPPRDCWRTRARAERTSAPSRAAAPTAARARARSYTRRCSVGRVYSLVVGVVLLLPQCRPPAKSGKEQDLSVGTSRVEHSPARSAGRSSQPVCQGRNIPHFFCLTHALPHRLRDANGPLQHQRSVCDRAKLGGDAAYTRHPPVHSSRGTQVYSGAGFAISVRRRGPIRALRPRAWGCARSGESTRGFMDRRRGGWGIVHDTRRGGGGGTGSDGGTLAGGGTAARTAAGAIVPTVEWSYARALRRLPHAWCPLSPVSSPTAGRRLSLSEHHWAGDGHPGVSGQGSAEGFGAADGDRRTGRGQPCVVRAARPGECDALHCPHCTLACNVHCCLGAGTTA
jgi:hypothetical protein